MSSWAEPGFPLRSHVMRFAQDDRIARFFTVHTEEFSNERMLSHGMKLAREIALVAVLTAAATHVLAGPALDEILNVMRLDQTAPHVDWQSSVAVTPSNPVGVSFPTGPITKKLCRIAINWGPTGESWTQDERLVLTLWDSREKRTKVAEYAMPYKFRSWEGGTIMFPLWVPVKPSSRYYFELTVQGGDGVIEGIRLSRTGCPNATMYVGDRAQEKCIWFETHVKGDFDRDAAYAAQFANWDLNYPGLEKVRAAVQAKDWDTACKELVAWYESREEFVPRAARTPTVNPNYDRKLADLAANQQWLDLDGNIVHIGPDWNYYVWWEKRGGVGLTRTGLMQPLSGGYRNTGDEKYAKAYNDMILAMCRDQPSPLKNGCIKPGAIDISPTFPTGIQGGSMWSALSIGPRANQALYWYSWFAGSPNFTLDARCAVLFSMVDMINVLALMKGGGNWETQIKSSLFGFANEHREFVRWKEWFVRGKDGVLENLKKAIQPDGSLEESSPNYHALSVNRFLSVLETCREINAEVPSWAESLTERGLDWLLYVTQGNWTIPAWGDTWQPMTCNLFERAFNYFHREEYRWYATRGKEGREPKRKSVAFPDGGWYVMRSGWGPDDLFLMTHNGPFPGHGHNDRLSIVAYAYGSELIVDPGIYSYGTREAAELTRSYSHSTVTVDDRDTVKKAGRSSFIVTTGFDYFSGTNAGYVGDEKTNHTRQIIFVKPDYWLIQDLVTGKGRHRVDSRFQLPQSETEFHDLTARAKVPSGAGIEIRMLDGQGFTLNRDSGRICLNEHLYPVPVARFSKESALPLTFATLLYPFPPGREPNVSTSRMELDQNVQGCSAFAVTGPFGTDRFIFGQSGKQVTTKAGKLALDGKLLVMRRSGQSQSMLLVDGRSAAVDRKQHIIAESDCTVSVTYAGSLMTIEAHQPEPSLKVFTGKSTLCRINGGPAIAVQPNSYFRPFEKKGKA